MKNWIAVLFSLALGTSFGISYEKSSAATACQQASVAPTEIYVPAPKVIEVPAHVGTTPFGWNGVINAQGKPLVGVVGTEKRFAILKQELDEARLPDDRLALMREIAALAPIYAMKANVPRNYLAQAPSHVVVVASYHVEAGDTLSKIASVLKADVNAIFLANPHAFVNGDPNMLMAGMDIRLPEKT